MKKICIRNIVTMLLCFAMLFSIASCNKTKSGESSSASSNQNSETASVESGLNSSSASDSSVASVASSEAGSSTGSSALVSSATGSKTSTGTVSRPKPTNPVDIIDPDPGAIIYKDNPTLVENKVDLKGKTIKIGTFWINDWKSNNTDLTAQKNYKAIKAIETDYNCKIQMVAMDSNFYLKNVAAATAAGKIYADIYESQMEMSKLAKNGYFQELSTVKSVGLKTNEWYTPITIGATIKGGVYGVGVKQNYVSRTCIFFNKSIAAKYQLGDIYSMVKNNQWTSAKFLELCEKVYSKSNKTVQGANSVFQPYLLNLIYGNDTSPVIMKNGYPVFNGTDSKVISQIDFAQKFVQKGLFAKDKSNEYPVAINWFMQQKVLFFFGDMWMRSDMSNLMPEGCDWGVLPIPMGPNAKNYTQIITNCRYLSLSKGSDVENSGKILVALAKRTNFTKSENNIEVAAKLQDKQSLDIINSMYTLKPRYFQYNNAFQVKAMECIIDNAMTPMQAMQAVSQSAQAEIDKEYT